MKKKLLIFSFIFFVCSIVIGVVQAHELLPKELLQYIKEHPSASQEEIESYLVSKPELYRNDPHYKEKIIKTVRNPRHGLFHNGFDFLKLGIGHILSGPDHILFVLSLLLIFTGFKDILRLTSVFTIAHSITLILAGTKILTLSSRIVEPLIALSIAYVAITTVFFKKIKFFQSLHGKRAGIFFFGLFHGLGFAGLLRDLGIPDDRFISSLLFFNLGIEVGQIVIVALALPLIFGFYKKHWYGILIKILAILISIIAFGWVIQRIFFSQ